LSYRARWLLVLPGESHASCEMREGGTREGRHEGGQARGRAGTREGRHEGGEARGRAGTREGRHEGREARGRGGTREGRPEGGQARGKTWVLPLAVHRQIQAALAAAS
jgi:hypothetical protein